jgi:hypothetical protein
MSSNDPEHDGGPDAEHPPPEPEPLDIDSAFAAIIAGWADEAPATWPAEEDLGLGRHRRADDSADSGARPDERDDFDGGRDELAVSGTGGPLVPSVEQPLEGPEDDIGRADAFVPPDPPPLPRGDVISRLAWGGVIVGPAFLLLAVLGWRSAPQILVLTALAGFVAGFIVLVARMPKHRDDDDDDGAVV